MKFDGTNELCLLYNYEINFCIEITSRIFGHMCMIKPVRTQ